MCIYDVYVYSYTHGGVEAEWSLLKSWILGCRVWCENIALYIPLYKSTMIWRPRPS